MTTPKTLSQKDAEAVLDATQPADRLAQCRADLEAATDLLREASDEAAKLRHDLVLICSSVYEQAVERDWCEEYDHWVDTINDRTSERHLTNCRHDLSSVFHIVVEYRTTQDRADIEDDVTKQLSQAMYAYVSGMITDLSVEALSAEEES